MEVSPWRRPWRPLCRQERSRAALDAATGKVAARPLLRRAPSRTERGSPMHTGFGRRGLLGGAGGILATATLPWDLALAQGAGTLRVGMTAAAVPLTNGVPDQGAEGHRFMGVTLYDQLVHWDLSKADAPAVLRPGLATAWKVDPANPKRWVFTLREGVAFHDGKKLTAQDVVFSFDRVLKTDAPHFDQRAAAFGRVRIPTVATWEAVDERTFALETRTVDSTVPYGVSWIGIVHQAAWEAAGKNWDAYSEPRITRDGYTGSAGRSLRHLVR